MKKNPMIGRRVRLQHCSDPYNRNPPGLEGTVMFVDDTGTLFVNWSNGSNLGLIPGQDQWEVLP